MDEEQQRLLEEYYAILAVAKEHETQPEPSQRLFLSSILHSLLSCNTLSYHFILDYMGSGPLWPSADIKKIIIVITHSNRE